MFLGLEKEGYQTMVGMGMGGGGGGVGAPQKKLWGWSGGQGFLGYLKLILMAPARSQDLTPFWSRFQFAWPRTPSKAWNWVKPVPEMEPAPSGGFSALGSPFGRPKGPRVGSREGCVQVPGWVHVALEHAHARTGRWTPHGGLWVDKRESQGLKTWCPHIGRVLDPFLALVCPSFKVLGTLGAENLTIQPSPEAASLPLYTKRGHSHLPRVNGLHYGFLLSLELKRVRPIRLNAKKIKKMQPSPEAAQGQIS